MDFNDQIAKTFFNNAFNNEMHKTFIGFFIPAIYIVYYIMFHGMNNQFEILRMKNGMTTTVIKVPKNVKKFTTVNSITTNDQFIYENGGEKMGVSGHHKKKEHVFAVVLLATG